MRSSERGVQFAGKKNGLEGKVKETDTDIFIAVYLKYH